MAISRTHRPGRFTDITGQSHITETLRNEVASGILGHAFLFSGPRGVGKTTTARVFAKALLNEKTEKGEPPLDSDVSKEIDEGKCIDLIEIDAASHTGVDNVREAIIEHVRFSPARWKRKVYIIDECHMLSPSAWNAMLKTLEEPPSYAFFILATTELHRVPETIKSRCQRFEFRRIESDALAERLKAIIAAEGISVDDDVIATIVRASDGCARDAESLLDQIASLGAKKITTDIASLILPSSRIPQTAELLRLASQRGLSASLVAVKKMLDEGIPAGNIIEDLLVIVRALIRSEDPLELERLKKGDDGERAIASLVGTLGRGELGDIALMLIERRRDLKTGTDPAFILELVILAIAGGLLPHAEHAPPAMETHTDQVKKVESKTNSPIQTEEKKDEPVKEEPMSAEAPAEVDLHELRTHWNAIIAEVEKENHSIPFILKVCRPECVNGRTVILRFSYAFHREKLLEDVKTKRIVEQAMRKVMGSDAILIDGILGSDTANGDSLASAPKDVVSRVLNAFGGEVVK